VQCCVWVLNPNCSLCRSPHPLTLLRILVRRIFETPCQSCLTDLWVDKARAAPGPTWFQNGNHVGFFPWWWEVPHSKNHVKYLDEEGHDNSVEDASGPYVECCLGMVPCQTWEPWWHLEPQQGWLNEARLQKQRCMLTVPHQPSQWPTVPTGCSPADTKPPQWQPGFFSRSLKEQFPLCDQVGWGSSNSRQPSTQLPVWLSSGSGLSIKLLHLSFLHSSSWLVIDFCRQLTKTFRVGPLLIFTAFLVGCSGIFHPEYDSVLGDGSHHAWLLGVDSAITFKIALDSSLTHVFTATSLSRFVLDGSPSSRQTWNLAQSVWNRGNPVDWERHLALCVDQISDLSPVWSMWSDTLWSLVFLWGGVYVCVCVCV